MATVNSLAITILFSYGTTSTNPANALTCQAVAPWGMSPARSSIRECLEDIIYRVGSDQSGVLGAYLKSQTLNGASGTGPTGYTTANFVGIP